MGSHWVIFADLWNGGESFTQYDSLQLIDIFEFPFSAVGENPDELRRLRLKKKLSLRQLAKHTGHSIGYLQQQLRKFGIDKSKGNLGIAPYGWDWTGKKLIKNGTEQAVIRSIKKLRKGGSSFTAIASELNQKGVPSKNGGNWWHLTVSNVIRRKSILGHSKGDS